MVNLLLIFDSEFENLFCRYQVSQMNPEKKNFLGNDFRQIDQNLWNSGKLVPQRFIFSKISLVKV